MKKIIRKKAQGLSLQTIVIAFLVLVVLVVLVIVFSGRVGWFSSSLKSCTSAGGSCEKECAIGQQVFPGTNCEQNEPKQVCCVSVD